MKRTLTVIAVIATLILPTIFTAHAATLKDGTILYSPGSYLAGQPIPLGFDPYGYNYQAHSFNGSYFNAYANGAGLPPYEGDDAAYLAANPGAVSHWAWPYRNDELAMKWNDAWLSNKDADDSGKLDRPSDNGGSYVGSGAWLTNHQSGEYEDSGETFNWNYFVKIVAVPSDAVLLGGFWFTPDGVEIGQEIWGDFAILLDVYNDQGPGDHGVLYHSPAGPGLGKF
jgi:hypothetical protein